ncbi:MAG: PorP/SprF family type IX secretion system membrane protein [Flavobacteriales bacterium]|nr:PorP/SprF family type IX secretion system membrane protein [Flavobacteriales bacterium]
MITSIACAQDIHFSQFFNVPSALNPGFIGQFDGDYRTNGVYRQQWRSVTVPYRTLGIGGDARDFAGKKGLGAGAWLYNDRAGDSRLNQFHLDLGASWTEALGTAGKHSITLGARLGFTSLTLDQGGMSFDSQYNGFYYDPNLNDGENFQRDGHVHADLHAGAAYRYKPEARKELSIGFGLFNITKPGIGFLGEPDVPLDMRTDLSVQLALPIADRWDLLPMLHHMAQGKFRELDAGANARYILLDRYGLKRAVLIGLHMRARDAGYLFAGLQRDAWTFGLSYDINTSDLVPASRNRGAIEFTAIRIWKKQPPVPVRFKACPEQL